MKINPVVLSALTFFGLLNPAILLGQLTPLHPGFQAPPNAATPRVWWHWMNGNSTGEGLPKDLEWMKNVRMTNFWVNRLIGDAQPNVVSKTTVTTMPFIRPIRPCCRRAC